MSRRFWVALERFDRDLVTAAIEAGAEALVVPEGCTEQVHQLGRITTIAADGDWQWGRDVERVEIASRADEARVDGRLPTIIDNRDWTIIPLENLLSRTGNLIQSVHNAEEAEVALQVMERGADGVLLATDEASEIHRTAAVVARHSREQLELVAVKVVESRPVAMSDRCCIDTTSLLPPGTGLLVGNGANAMFLVHNENIDSPYAAARPFRVNAGAVHAYVRCPNDRTAYLSELNTGAEVLACDPRGEAHTVVVGRNKIERRPMLLLRAADETGREVALILQNAETVRLTAPDGSPVAVTECEPGTEALAWFGDGRGRHFGQALEESLQEQ